MTKIFSVRYQMLEILLSKDIVEFNNGFGIVRTPLIIDDCIIPLVGIVNENYELVYGMYECSAIPKLEILANGNVLLVCRIGGSISGESDYSVLHFVCDERGITTKYDLGNDGFVVVDDNTILLYTNVLNVQFMTLYDVNKMQILMPYLNGIGPFYSRDDYEEEVANAFWDIYDDNNYHRLHFLINKRGDIVSSVRDDRTGSEYTETDYFKLADLVRNNPISASRARVNLDNKEN